MVDLNKRTALKVLGGSAVIATVPSISVACERYSNGHGSELTASTKDIVVPLGNEAELTAVLTMEPVPTITLTNNSDMPILIRHVHPGIVHAGEKTFDINSIFAHGPLTLDAGTNQSHKVAITYSTQAEKTFPRHLYSNKPQRVMALSGNNSYGNFVHSSRIFYS